MEQPHANQTVLQKQSTFLWKNVPNLVHFSKCVWVTMVTLYGTTSPTQKRMHVIIWDRNRSRQVSFFFFFFTL